MPSASRIAHAGLAFANPVSEIAVDAAIAALPLGGATVDELSDLDGLHASLRDLGFEILHESLTSELDWASYEETLAANAERHGTPDTLAYARRIRHRRSRPVAPTPSGFALVVLRA